MAAASRILIVVLVSTIGGVIALGLADTPGAFLRRASAALEALAQALS